MKLKVRYFGMIKDVTSIDNEEIEMNFSSQNLNVLIDLLEQKYVALKNVNYSVAVNHKIENNEIAINDGDEIALLPAFSGG